MVAQGDSNNVNDIGEISFKDLLFKFKAGIRYLKARWVIILFCAVCGGGLGFLYSIIKKTTYTGICTFVLEDSKNGGMGGQYASLASMAGINLSGSGGGGIFEGDNILELYKSRTMIEKALLSTYYFNGKKQLLIDRFIDRSNMRSLEKNDDKIGFINFNGNPDNFSRVQDSVVTLLVDLFNKKVLDVNKPDKKLNIISVGVTTQDELFSKYFTERLVQNVNDFYVQTKSKKAYQNVNILQHQADSAKALLNSSIYGVASAIDAAPNANPDLSALRVPSQKKQIEVQANSAIYSEMVKNLELAKISLRQEMPLIQVIDKPVLPLVKTKPNKIINVAVGIIAGFFLSIAILILKKISGKLQA